MLTPEHGRDPPSLADTNVGEFDFKVASKRTI